MKKLFISQPMRGKSDEEILAERQKAIEAAEKVIGEPAVGRRLKAQIWLQGHINF